MTEIKVQSEQPQQEQQSLQTSSKSSDANKSEKKSYKIYKDRATIYVGHIPHGFYEKEMRAYFKQFGDVTRLRLSRSKRTGRCRGYGFVEFKSKDTAQVVVDTMHNYLIMGKLLQVKLLDQSKLHPDIWVGCSRRYDAFPTTSLKIDEKKCQKMNEQELTDERVQLRLAKRQQKKEALKQKLAGAGIDYDY
ncbi:hypothetical protein MP228_001284 [Amoeboaphelidium protococcarum]|nr:hypothetical protein MP228_001284 [Amoeboaphelidium protococcarum]